MPVRILGSTSRARAWTIASLDRPQRPGQLQAPAAATVTVALRPARRVSMGSEVSLGDHARADACQLRGRERPARELRVLVPRAEQVEDVVHPLVENRPVVS